MVASSGAKTPEFDAEAWASLSAQQRVVAGRLDPHPLLVYGRDATTRLRQNEGQKPLRGKEILCAGAAA
jgi:hypothetical protein